jgi:hypothetical protein
MNGREVNKNFKGAVLEMSKQLHRLGASVFGNQRASRRKKAVNH